MHDLFQSLYDDFSDAVYAYFCACFDRDGAQDLTQQTFMKVFRYISSHKTFVPDSWRAWIFRIAVNVKNDKLREMQKTDEVEYNDSCTSLTVSTEETSLVAVSVNNAFTELSQTDREVLTFVAMGMKSAEISKIVGISDSAVRTRIATAKTRFKAMLEIEGVIVGDR